MHGGFNNYDQNVGKNKKNAKRIKEGRLQRSRDLNGWTNRSATPQLFNTMPLDVDFLPASLTIATYIQAHTYTHMHAHTYNKDIHLYTHAHSYIHSHAYRLHPHTQVQTRAYTYIHIHTHDVCIFVSILFRFCIYIASISNDSYGTVAPDQINAYISVYAGLQLRMNVTSVKKATKPRCLD